MQVASSAVTVTSDTTSITVAWDADPTLQNLTVYLDNELKTTQDPSLVGQYSVQNLSPGTSYDVEVLGFSNSGSQTSLYDANKSTSEYSV